MTSVEILRIREARTIQHGIDVAGMNLDVWDDTLLAREDDAI